MIKIKRAYEAWDKDDGFRILVDKLWPRGISKKEAHIDLWIKELAPSTQLRQWFNHDPLKWQEFQKRYKKELDNNQESVNQVKRLRKEHKEITLVYAAKDEKHNDAVALLDYLKKQIFEL